MFMHEEATSRWEQQTAHLQCIMRWGARSTTVWQRATGKRCIAGAPGGPEWEVLRPRLLPAAAAWLDPGGARGWRAGPGLVASADPAAAALNLLLFLLGREARDRTNLTGVRSPAASAQA